MLLDRQQASSGEVILPGLPGRADAGARPRPLTRRPAPSWVRSYTAALVIVETLLAGAAGAAVLLARADQITPSTRLFWAALVLLVAWPVLLGATGAYSERVYGTGSDEYRRVGRAGFMLVALAALVSYVGALDLSRSLVLVALPALVLVTLLGRVAARWQLRHLRTRGLCTKRVVVVGRGGSVLELRRLLQREHSAGLDVVALCVPPADRSRVTDAADVPVGGLDQVVELATRLGADTIAVTSASETAAQYLRQLSWQLEGSGMELLVAPGLIEVAGPRLHIRPFEGLPLLAVEQPRFEGWQRMVKGAFDRTTAALAIVVLSPLLVGIALAVRLSSPGPVLFRQERIGINGRSFTMLKFRSMVVDADNRVDELSESNISDGLLFKLRRDPRVTPVGRWLRRLSLDELPQLLNVMGGTMSLVGPRPPLPREVARYDSSVSRRLLVKPGLTGLWQISGRSDLPWEEAVRLDLRYVENWSLALDTKILWKTFAAVTRARGAY
ncbi:sugar transferase [Blastococcus xanthinilyticus]|uniref:Undecaprenyl-phosphate galactose phosphotransferase WbaP/exopolysaccharide biosynthesis polyprenyl glycosylphosphotransferase n=1 Tax=Blastococcus xanthinilyticus TaxID=1564164 RepID=A0A5S5CRA3_9ACTN|nr:sugar transferase [Blastococcus xanthinilyticus]TYP86223.1 Undecaprenyl-phosphate galactose phosphotransferase WbaP/exopolysaccharide biosynthesis polyprenyl glycosylphosphotransferase [Blastococcus xanthinilyticus]